MDSKIGSFAHTHYVSSIVWHPENEEILLSSSADLSIKAWDTTKGELLHVLEGNHTNDIWTVCFDGKTVVSSSWDSIVRVFDWNTKKLLHEMKGHKGHVLGCTMYQNKAITSGDDKTIKVWNLENGTLEKTITVHGSSVFEVRAYKKYLVSCSRDLSVGVFDLSTFNLVKTIMVEKSGLGEVKACALTKDEKFMVAALGNDVKCFELGTGKLVHTFKHTRTVTTVDTYGGDKVIAGDRDSFVKIWSISTGKLEKSVKSAHGAWIRMVRVSPKEGLIATCSDDRRINLWNLKTTPKMIELKEDTGKKFSVTEKFVMKHDRGVYDCLISQENNFIATTCEDGVVRTFNLSNGTLEKKLEGHDRAIYGCCVVKSEKGSYIASAGWSDIVAVHKLEGKLVRKTKKKGRSQVITTSKDSKKLIVGAGNNILVYDFSNGKLLKEFKGHSSFVLDMEVVGNILISVSKDATCKVWDIDALTIVRAIDVSKEVVHSVSSNGKVIACGDDNGFLCLFEFKSGRLIKKAKVLDNAVKSVVIIDTLDVMVAGDKRGNIVFLDYSLKKVGEGKYSNYSEIRRMRVHEDKFLLVCGDERNAKMYEIKMEEAEEEETL